MASGDEGAHRPMLPDELQALQRALDRFGEEHPEVDGVDHVRAQITAIIGETAEVRDAVRALELSDLRRVPLGNALFTRDSFLAEYGEPVRLGDSETVDLAGQDAADRCIFCDGDRFTVETYATDRPRIHVRFWWCQSCGLGRAISWGMLNQGSSVHGP